jgi:hypothetical protein
MNSLFDGLYAESDMKTCVKCKQILPNGRFGNASGGNYLRAECKSCARQLTKERVALRKITPLPPKDYCCPICHRNEEQAAGSGGKSRSAWCLDHNHTTKEFRGYLCHSCNRTIGQLDEDISRLHRAIEYLQNAN